jgi:hypothetical protein
MPRMSWPSWRRTRTVTRAAGEVKPMATGAGRRREARTRQPGAEQQGRGSSEREARRSPGAGGQARDGRGLSRRGAVGVPAAGQPGPGSSCRRARPRRWRRAAGRGRGSTRAGPGVASPASRAGGAQPGTTQPEQETRRGTGDGGSGTGHDRPRSGEAGGRDPWIQEPGGGFAAPGEDGGAEQSARSEQRGGGDGAWAARLPGGAEGQRRGRRRGRGRDQRRRSGRRSRAATVAGEGEQPSSRCAVGGWARGRLAASSAWTTGRRRTQDAWPPGTCCGGRCDGPGGARRWGEGKPAAGGWEGGGWKKT